MKLCALFASLAVGILLPFPLKAESGPSGPDIVATTGMIADVVKAVVGEQGKVTLLMKEGVDPHLFKPTRADIAKLTKADIIFYNGLLLEGKLTDALNRISASGTKVVAVTQPVGTEFLLEPEGYEGQYDPHLWMDPVAWTEIVKVISGTLTAAIPNYRDEIEKNARAYAVKLEQLHAYATKVLESVSEDSRVLVTAHDAFNYFGRRYGYEVLGIQGISTESEAGVRDIQNLVDLLVERKISALFVESTVSDRNIRALIEGANAKGHKVRIGGTLFSDAMGPTGTYTGTYIGMIDHNVSTIAAALGGQVPDGGMQGLLRLGSKE